MCGEKLTDRVTSDTHLSASHGLIRPVEEDRGREVRVNVSGVLEISSPLAPHLDRPAAAPALA